MKTYTTLLLALVSLALVTGCDDETTTADNNNTVQHLLPLKVGNLWSYNFYEYNEDGSLRNESTTKISVDDTASHDNWPGFRGEVFGKEMIRYYYGNIEVRYVDYNSDCLVIYPMTVNKPWRSSTADSGVSKHSERIVTLLSSDEQVTVPAGTFTALHYETIRTSQMTKDAKPISTLDTVSATHSYYALNVGLIKQEEFTAHKLVGRYTLYNYKLK